MKIELIKGDITKLEVDAIVNAANAVGPGGIILRLERENIRPALLHLYDGLFLSV